MDISIANIDAGVINAIVTRSDAGPDRIKEDSTYYNNHDSFNSGFRKVNHSSEKMAGTTKFYPDLEVHASYD